MIIVLLFVSQIILLSIGFSVSYWLLTTASTREGNLKTMGETLGFILIGATILLELANFVYSIAAASNYCAKRYCPVSSVSEPVPNSVNQEQGVTPQLPDQDEGTPIKRDIKDHE